MAPVYSVAVLLYSGADVLDFSGPVEIYSTLPPAGTPSQFKITTFALQNPVKAGSDVLTYIPDKSLAEIDANLNDYDIVVVPGGHPDDLTKLIASNDGKTITGLLKRFAGLPPRKETGSRILQSVCTGSLLLAASGILAGRTVTTHHIAYDLIKEIADKAAGGESKMTVAKKRWIDAGTTEAGVRIVNAGGVTSGIDASLWIMEELAGKEAARWTAEIVEFERRGQGDAWGV